ncbi:MAG: FapA family protein [Lachnospiraceae bacterium]|nr:FapA family protein [Lachnospiraceae bacterium]
MNGYFQLINANGMTSVRLVPPTDGGMALNVNELTDYLSLKNVKIDNLAGFYQAFSAASAETVIPVTGRQSYPQQEMLSVTISDDHMTATARFYPPSNDGELLKDADEIIQDLKFRKVIVGIDEQAIKSFLANRRYCEDIVVARGIAPVHGTDASIEYFFNTNLSVRPTRNEDGSVDFFHLNTINHCKEGDLLARLTKEVEGKLGQSVTGDPIRPRQIKRLSLKYGNNIDINEEKTELRSKVNGHVSLVTEKVFVSDVYEVENVGTATGNVESEGSVVVNGNVLSGFAVHAKGNVEVRGVVEGAEIVSDGDIIVARGINGMGKGILKAGGRVIMKYAENATIIAGDYVESESILHSNVSAGTEVRVEGKKGFIAGGIVRATEKITCKTLGSEMGADTVVEVGMDPQQKKIYQELQKEIGEIQKNLANIEPILANATARLRRGEKFKPEQVKYIQSLSEANKQQSARMEEVKAQLRGLDEKMRGEGNACVIVTGDAYQGSKIAIGDVSMVLRKSMAYTRFIKDKGDIRATAI